MDEFVVIEPLVSSHREKLIPILRACVNETAIDLDSGIPHYVYNLGQNTGVMGFNVYGDPIAYALYNKTPNNPIIIMHFWVHPELRRRRIGSRIFSYISRTSVQSPLIALVHETLPITQVFLRSLGFRCIHIIRNKLINNDQYQFTANALNPMNRLSAYNPQPF